MKLKQVTISVILFIYLHINKNYVTVFNVYTYNIFFTKCIYKSIQGTNYYFYDFIKKNYKIDRFNKNALLRKT